VLVDEADTAVGFAARTPLPATPETLLEYVTHLIMACRAPSTVEQAVAAIRTRHRVAGFKGEPDTEAARLALRGYRRDRAKAGIRLRKSLPVTITVLQAVLESCDPATLAGKRDRVLLVLGYALYSRRSELAALHIEDVQHTEQGLAVLIRTSKTDKDSTGELVPVKRGRHPETDPVAIVDDWLAALSARDVTAGPLLRAVTRHGALHPAGAMSGAAVNERVRTLAGRAGIPGAEHLTAHGLRSGPASTAAKHGAPVSAIAEQGRWSPTSPVVYGYVRAADRWNQYPDIGL
jgi:integrase